MQGTIIARLALAGLVLVLASCAASPDEPTDDGLLRGWEFGNRQDMEQVREERAGEIDR